MRDNGQRDIVARKRRADGRVMRELSCGHHQLQPLGSKANGATFAFCVVCRPTGPLGARLPLGRGSP